MHVHGEGGACARALARVRFDVLTLQSCSNLQVFDDNMRDAETAGLRERPEQCQKMKFHRGNLLVSKVVWHTTFDLF